MDVKLRDPDDPYFTQMGEIEGSAAIKKGHHLGDPFLRTGRDSHPSRLSRDRESGARKKGHVDE